MGNVGLTGPCEPLVPMRLLLLFHFVPLLFFFFFFFLFGLNILLFNQLESLTACIVWHYYPMTPRPVNPRCLFNYVRSSDATWRVYSVYD